MQLGDHEKDASHVTDGSTVSGLALNPATGALTAVQNSPFKATAQPTSIAAVTHGNHAIEVIQP